MNFSLLHEDVLDVLHRIDDATIDLIIIDPAYESLEKHRNHGTTVRLRDWFPIFPNHRFVPLFEQLWRVLRPNRHFFMMCDDETHRFVAPIAKRAGFDMWTPWIWDKMRTGMGYHGRCSYELIDFFTKGSRQLNDRAMRNILRVPSIRRRGRYPTEKPMDLMKIIVEQSSQPGEVVFDGFCGAGSVGAAAVRAGRRFIGCDVAERAVDLTRRRLRAGGGHEGPLDAIVPLVPQLELPCL